MRLRYKTYLEFAQQIKIVNRIFGGRTIVCSLNDAVVLKTPTKPWNSPQTRKSFLVKLYIEQVLQKINVSEKISRMPGYELLGKRFKRNGDTLIIVSSVEVVDTSTGEVDEELLVKNITNPFRLSPFKILKSKCGLLK